MKKIPLSQNKFALVDDEDYERLMVHGWCAVSSSMGSFYAAHSVRPYAGAKTVTVRMHRVVARAKPGQVVDHINHDTLDNRKANLRIVTTSQNMMNRRGPRKNTELGIRGVYHHKQTGKYRAMIRVRGSLKHLGLFSTIEEASTAYANANKKFFGEYGGLS